MSPSSWIIKKNSHPNYELQYVWGRSTAKSLGLQSKNHVHSLKTYIPIFFLHTAWHQQSQSHGNNDVREDRCRRRRIPVGNETLAHIGISLQKSFQGFLQQSNH